MTMRLSEAIRLGALLKPQAFGGFTDGVGTCAWGAAHEALGLPVDADYGWLPRHIERFSARRIAACPVEHCCAVKTACRMDSVIVHLNDDHKWTREQIADWVQTIEDAQAAHDTQPQAEESAGTAAAVAVSVT